MPNISMDFKSAMGVVDKPTIPSDDVMREMSFANMTALRNAYSNDMETQKKLAPFEHAAFAREIVDNNPAMAIPLSFMIPGYQIYKVGNEVAKSYGVGDETATPPNKEQLTEAFKAIYETLRKKK